MILHSCSYYATQHKELNPCLDFTQRLINHITMGRWKCRTGFWRTNSRAGKCKTGKCMTIFKSCIFSRPNGPHHNASSLMSLQSPCWTRWSRGTMMIKGV